jgi:D-3-phosphoglycerate dehydrogenase
MDILITEDFAASAIQELSQRRDVVWDAMLWKDGSKLRQMLGAARTVMVRHQTSLTRDVLAAAPELLAIGRVGVGLDNIDMTAASQLGVVVVAPLGGNATSVAEFTLGLILALARRIPSADRSTRAGAWDRKACMGIELEGKTLALCGFGRVGQQVATRARAFGLRLRVFDPFLAADAPALRETGAVRCASLTEALAEADFVTTHTPLTPETRHLFGARSFAAMKRGAFFINTSRGGVVDEAALLDALESGHLGGAALDVREVEPPVEPGAFAARDNVILTPHIASFTSEAQGRTLRAVIEDIERLLSGEPTVNFVNFARPQRHKVIA